MALDRGKILEQVVRKKTNISSLAAKLGVARPTIYRHFETPDLDYGTILNYAKALQYDFKKEFPEMGLIAQEPQESYTPMTLSEALQQIEYWKDKYIGLLESYNDILNERTG